MARTCPSLLVSSAFNVLLTLKILDGRQKLRQELLWGRGACGIYNCKMQKCRPRVPPLGLLPSEATPTPTPPHTRGRPRHFSVGFNLSIPRLLFSGAPSSSAVASVAGLPGSHTAGATTAAGSRSHEASKDTETNRQRHGTRGTIIYNRQYANDALPTTEDAPPSHKHPHWSFSRQTANHTAKTAHSRAQMRRSPFRSPRPPPALHLSFRKASAPSFCGA